MMKRRCTAWIIAFVFLLLAGCGGAGSTATDAGFAQEDLSLMVGGTAYRCNDDILTVIANLGEDYQYAEGMSCDYDGLDKTYLYEQATFYTNPLAEGDLVGEIYTESPAVSTTKGVAVGSPAAEVLAAYGPASEELDGLLIYRLPDERATLCFEIENDEVWAIYLTTQSV